MADDDSQRIHQQLTELLHTTAQPATFFRGLVEFMSSISEVHGAEGLSGTSTRERDGSAGKSPLELAEHHPPETHTPNFAQSLAQIFAQAQLAEIQSGILHDIGGFLQSIVFSSEVITDCVAELANASGDTTREVLEQISQAAVAVQESARTGADVLRSTAGLGRGHFASPVWVPLPWALTSSLALLRWREPEIRIKSAVPEIEIQIRLSHLRRVLFNLLSNARDATAGRAQPKIEVGAHVRGTSLYIEVADNGPGIAPEHIDAVFRPFFTTKEGGAGLGLFVCRQLVEGWLGQIGVQRIGDETVFWLTIPLTYPPRPHSQETSG